MWDAPEKRTGEPRGLLWRDPAVVPCMCLCVCVCVCVCVSSQWIHEMCCVAGADAIHTHTEKSRCDERFVRTPRKLPAHRHTPLPTPESLPFHFSLVLLPFFIFVFLSLQSVLRRLPLTHTHTHKHTYTHTVMYGLEHSEWLRRGSFVYESVQDPHVDHGVRYGLLWFLRCVLRIVRWTEKGRTIFRVIFPVGCVGVPTSQRPERVCGPSLMKMGYSILRLSLWLSLDGLFCLFFSFFLASSWTSVIHSYFHTFSTLFPHCFHVDVQAGRKSEAAESSSAPLLLRVPA